MWSSAYDSYPMINNQPDDFDFMNTLPPDEIYTQDLALSMITPLVPNMNQNAYQTDASQRLSLEIQPCISITEPTPIGMPSLNFVDQLIADNSPVLPAQQPQVPFLNDFLSTGQQEAEWLSWTPNIQLSPALSVSTLDDFDINSFHSLDFINTAHSLDFINTAHSLDVNTAHSLDINTFHSFDLIPEIIPPSPSFEEHLTVQPDNKVKRNRRLSEPPKPSRDIHSTSQSSIRRTQSEKRSRSNSASNGSYPCTHSGCDKVFKRPYNLLSHMRTHTSEKPFACSQCGRKFARQHDRNRHEKLHWGIKPFACKFCSKSFARMDALNRHLRVENGCASSIQKL